MATAFTDHSTVSNGEWSTACGTSIDISGVEQAILDDITGNSYLVKSITLDYEKTDKWLQVLDGDDLQIGPMELGSDKHWEKVFQSGLVFDGGVYIEAENPGLVSVIVEYKIIPS